MSVSVLLIGASGAFGQPLVQEFIQQRSSFKRVSILAANEAKATKFATAKANGIDVVVGSFLEPSSYAGFTHVISAVGNALMRLQPAMIEAAIKAGVTHFYPSEWNSDIAQKWVYNNRYFHDKVTTRAHLIAKAKENPDFKYTLMVTGIFTEWSVMEFYGFDHENATAELYGRPEARIGVTSIPDIVHYTVSSLLIPFKGTHPNIPNERTIRVSGSSQTFGEVVDALDKARGRSYTVNYHDPAELESKQDQARRAGEEQQEMTFAIKPLVGSGYGVADGDGAKLDNGLFDFQPETLTETFERIYAGKK